MSDLAQLESGGHTHAHAFDSKAVRKEIWKITLYLTVLTIIELILGFTMMNWEEGSFKRDFVKGIIIILMLWKAFYIIGYFMHLRHEVKTMIMVIALPALFFVWFIIAFLKDGSSYKNLRATEDPYKVELSKQPMPAHEEKENTHEVKPAPESQKLYNL
ncbi:hypothetical protein A9P82_13570 [Arachidicoccus ginsenosidimutans]|uniref:cytochrome C oxidase subunit IV family protein n=1 Tax=Arachidicoccus sp. BS20 TaxID=1850526 RepID=UPI0007F10B2A|nr:cytochrome C oxidase subunit IV family protein [Arachidicoccus sp. BS20]ANI90227.1 hypothetical protein A9P82_13570 [Arachidicoccus sp. BS20]